MQWRDETGLVHSDCVVFFKVREEFGGLSNMSGEFPLRVNGLRVPSSEGLYQACRFPHRPDWQEEIVAEASPLAAKMKSRKDGRVEQSRPDWPEVRLDVMRWVLRVKLAQHRRFGGLLRATGDRPVVEKSRKDPFWGAVEEADGLLVGQNHLGRLLMDLRRLAVDRPREELLEVGPLDVPDFLLLGQPIDTVRGVAPAPAG